MSFGPPDHMENNLTNSYAIVLTHNNALGKEKVVREQSEKRVDRLENRLQLGHNRTGLK